MTPAWSCTATNKRSLLEELRRTLRLGKPSFRGIEDLESLTAYRDRLNAYAAAVNAPASSTWAVDSEELTGERLLRCQSC